MCNVLKRIFWAMFDFVFNIRSELGTNQLARGIQSKSIRGLVVERPYGGKEC